MRIWHYVICSMLLLGTTSGARAYDWAPYGDSLGSIDYTTFLNRTYLDNATRPAGPKARPQAKSSTVVARDPSAPTSTPAELAASYPPAKRAEAETVFKEMLKGYAAIEQQFGIPKNDLAGALAAFLAGSYMAYHNSDFPDANFKPLVEQMRTVISQRPEFEQLGAAEKRDLFEKFAILGMYCATAQMALKKTPDATVEANMREGGRRYLAHFLGDAVDSVSLTDKGLTFAPGN
jgi:hypothetical protein